MCMIKLTEVDIDQALQKIERGLRQYCWIQANFQRCDVSKDLEFQTQFNSFYKVKRRSQEWRDHYYALMQSGKGQGITFPEALGALKDRDGRIEASFASKLVATLNPAKPVIDQFVLRNFDLRLPYYYVSNREAKTTELYNLLCMKYEVLISSQTGRLILAKFHRRYPWAEITDLKRIDLVLWQIRPAKA